MKELIRKILKEIVTKKEVICDKCGWSWDLSDGGDDMYICHKCGHDNTPVSNKTNLEIVIDEILRKNAVDSSNLSSSIKNFLKKLINRKSYNIKFLNYCTPFGGVRTGNQIIICSPNQMSTLGDFLYTIFHEIRHEQQMSEMKLINPLDEMDLNDFENLYKQYWEMELDADQFAKNSVNKLISTLRIPEDKKKLFELSEFIQSYPQRSDNVKQTIKQIVLGIKKMKDSGIEYSGLQDHPLIKPHLKSLQNLI